MSKLSGKPKGERLQEETVVSRDTSMEASGDRLPESFPPGTEDPVSIGQESHPMSVGACAVVGGATAGALGGAVGGPVGAVVGSALGAVAGGLGARTLSEAIEPSLEVDFWADECTRRNYYDPNVGPAPFLVAYRIGFENHDPKVHFEDRRSELKSRWEASEAANQITWFQAQSAMRDAWQRVASQYYPSDMVSQKTRPNE